MWLFSPLKSKWAQYAKHHAQFKGPLSAKTFKTTFIPFLLNYVKRIQNNIVSGFRKCGIYPFDSSALDLSHLIDNPEVVVDYTENLNIDGKTTKGTSMGSSLMINKVAHPEWPVPIPREYIIQTNPFVLQI